MANMIDYLKWRGDLKLEQIPFNEVDDLILSEFTYLQMEDLVPAPEEEGRTALAEVCRRYTEKGYDQSKMMNDPRALAMAAGESLRFRDIFLSDYVNRVAAEEQMQFSAVVFHLGEDEIYVGFRGTDNTIVGWREDFNISYQETTAGQQAAVEYLNRIGKKFHGRIRTGGHSKGGNLAVYGAAFCDPEIRERILSVTSHDGPGFLDSITEQYGYQAVEGRVRHIIPSDSVVGILLSGPGSRKVIRSSEKGVMQHDPYSWQTDAHGFEEAEGQQASSQFLDEAVSRWLDGMDTAQRKNMVTAVFDSLEASGAFTLTEMNENKWRSYNAVLKAVKDMDPDLYKEVMGNARKLAAAGTEVLREEAQKRIGELLEPIHRGLEAASFLSAPYSRK